MGNGLCARIISSFGVKMGWYFRSVPIKCCKSCEDVEDTSHWTLMEPFVSMETGEPVYKHSSSSGSFECTVSGLRWVCAGEVTVQYRFSDPNVFKAELAMLQYEPIGPLMDIKVLSGKLLEAHLPHFACLEGSDCSLQEAVRVLHGVDSSVRLETCELTRFHAKLLKPSFSLLEVLVKIGIPVKAHLDVLIYQTRVMPLALHTYVVPRDASMIQAVREDLHEIQDVKRIKKHRPDKPVWMGTKLSLNTSHNHAKTSPSEITLKSIKPPDLFETVIENAEDSFDLKLISEGKSIWEATVESFEFAETGEVAHTHIRTEEDEGKMAPMSKTEPCSPSTMPGQDFFHKHKATLEIRLGLLRPIISMLERLRVLNTQEIEEVKSKDSQVEQNRTLLLMLERKGGLAQEEFCRVLMICDEFLVKDLEKQHNNSW